MSTFSAYPVESEIAGAVGKFFHGGTGPSHSAITRVLTACGYSDGHEYSPDKFGPNKEQRILSAFTAARGKPANGRKLLEGLLSELRLNGDITSDSGAQTQTEMTLRAALLRYGWYLNNEGLLRAAAGIDIETHGREALAENVERLRRSTADPALLLGTAKDLLESVAKFVLEEHGMLPAKANINQIL